MFEKLPRIEYTPPDIPPMLWTRWAPALYVPTQQDRTRMFAQSMVISQIRREIEDDADKLWQIVLRSEKMRSVSVADLDVTREWWFRAGYSEHVQRRGEQARQELERVRKAGWQKGGKGLRKVRQRRG